MKTKTQSGYRSDDVDKRHELILYNDDKHSVPEVMDMLMTLCKHSVMQAEQCVLIAHNVGKCSIKRGGYTNLLDLSFEMKNHGFNVEII